MVAKVIGELKDNALILGKDVKLPSKDRPPQELPTIKDASKTPEQFQTIAKNPDQQAAPRNWILQIGDKYLITQSSMELVPGKFLAVTKNANETLSFGNLTPQDQSTLDSLLRQTMTRTLPQQASMAFGFKAIAELAQSVAANGPQADNAAPLLATLITNLVQKGMPNSKLLAVLYQMGGIDNVGTSPSAAQTADFQKTIEAWLKNSGIAFEAKQMSASGNSDGAFNALKQQADELSIIWRAISLGAQANPNTKASLLGAADVLLSLISTTEGSAQPKQTKETLATLNQGMINAKAPAKLIETLQAYQQALQMQRQAIETVSTSLRSIVNAPSILNGERLPQNIEQALTNYKNYTDMAMSSLAQLAAQLSSYHSQHMQTHGVPPSLNTQMVFEAALQHLPLAQTTNPDLKALLQSIVHGLKASIASTREPSTAQEAKLDMRGSLESALLNRPFDFPQFDRGILKAQAILADQELTTGQLLKLIAGMLNRIQFNQANSLLQSQASADTALTQSWNMELPYLHEQQIQTLQLRIDQHQSKQNGSEKQEGGDQQRTWTIELSFEFENIGPLHIKAELSPPNLKTELWVANKQAETLVSQEQALFVSRLQDAGLEVESPVCRIGTPERKHKAHIKQGLVDIHA